MFLGSSLLPDYFSKKVNLYVALAPNISTVQMGKSFLTEHLRILQLLVVDILQYYNWFAPMPAAVELVVTACDIVPGVCNWLKQRFIHSTTDSFERFDVFLSNEPSGAGYRTWIYYMQQRHSGRVQLYDYGKIKNIKKYG